ncbi:unnamed protein product, partial [Notodromas monacha]
MSKHDKMIDGDWVCPNEDCQNLNFARRTQCNRCGIDKPFSRQSGHKGGIKIGKAAAEKSRGLFSADDWQCPKCGNVNWARRSTCNVCNAPRTGEEERTGLGGGYNEREDVEYKEREDSDGEYDEFGRRKKKFRGNESDSSTPSASKTKPSKDQKEASENEEEDDDEEEDGDLSKYDLWGSDAEEDTKKADTEEKTTTNDKPEAAKNKRSRSRSRSSSSERRSRYWGVFTRSEWCPLMMDAVGRYITPDVWWYYMIELSFYWALMVSQFTDVKRRDFAQ